MRECECVCEGVGIGIFEGGRKGKGVFESTFLCVQRRVFPRIFRKILWETAAELEANPKSHYVRSLCTFVAYFSVFDLICWNIYEAGKTEGEMGQKSGLDQFEAALLCFFIRLEYHAFAMWPSQQPINESLLFFPLFLCVSVFSN